VAAAVFVGLHRAITGAVRSDDCMQDEQTVERYLRDHDQKQLQNMSSGQYLSVWIISYRLIQEKLF